MYERGQEAFEQGFEAREAGTNDRDIELDGAVRRFKLVRAHSGRDERKHTPMHLIGFLA